MSTHFPALTSPGSSNPASFDKLSPPLVPKPTPLPPSPLQFPRLIQKGALYKRIEVFSTPPPFKVPSLTPSKSASLAENLYSNSSSSSSSSYSACLPPKRLSRASSTFSSLTLNVRFLMPRSLFEKAIFELNANKNLPIFTSLLRIADIMQVFATCQLLRVKSSEVLGAREDFAKLIFKKAFNDYDKMPPFFRSALLRFGYRHRKLTLCGFPLSMRLIELTAKAFPKLRSLDLSRASLTDSLLAISLKKICLLQKLDLSHNPKLTHKGLIELPNLRQLQVLYLDGCNLIGDSALNIISTATTLTLLSLNRCRNITNAGISALCTLLELEHLGLAESCINEVGFAALATLPQLQILDLSHCAVTDKVIEDMPCLRYLLGISLAHCQAISDEGIITLAENNRELVSLNINNCPSLTKISLNALSYIESLEELSVINCPNIKARHIKHFFSQKNCTIAWDKNRSILEERDNGAFY